MPTLTDSLVASSARPLAMRMRPDLVAWRHSYQGRPFWVVKEPIGLAYFRFQEEEYAILTMLDGRASLDDVKRQFEARFRPQKIATGELQRLLGTLHRNGLVLSDAAGQGDQLRERGATRHRSEVRSRWTNILAIRFSGFDTDRLLDRLIPYFRWLFHPAAFAVCALLALIALLLVAIRFDSFQARLPGFHEFFAARNWIWLAATLAVTKVLHEFGHGLACKHFGGEVHEMGFMLLAFTPALYCNVSDSSLLRSKWQRALVGAAGMYVELVLASLATLLWWASAPGLLNMLCLNVMFVSSISTLMFNANPLLRYDGYYILADLVEIPNLRQKASTLLERTLTACCLGLQAPADPFLPHRHRALFIVYTVAAAIYRWVVTFSILWFLYKLFEPYGLKVVGQLLALASIYALVARPTMRIYQFFTIPGRRHQVKRTRVCASLAVLSLATAAVLFVPLPSSIYCAVDIKPRGASQVYVDVAGRLESVLVAPGDEVAVGQPLARLTNVDLELDVAKLEGERNAIRTQLASLQQQRFRDPNAGLEIEHVRESLAALEASLAAKQRDLDRLELISPTAGAVLPPPATPEPKREDEELPTWFGTPLLSRNVGATLSESTLFCQIGDPSAMEAILVIDQTDIERIVVGQPVEILLDQSPAARYRGTIAEVAQQKLDASATRLSHKSGGELATRTDSLGIEHPLSASYQALVPLEAEAGILRQGLRGRAKVAANWETLASRGWRYLARTFQFEL